MAARDFTRNPALDFISAKPTEQETVIPLPHNAVVNETKSKRVQLLLYPSIYEAMKKKAESRGISLNELANEIMREHTAE